MVNLVINLSFFRYLLDFVWKIALREPRTVSAAQPLVIYRRSRRQSRRATLSSLGRAMRLPPVELNALISLRRYTRNLLSSFAFTTFTDVNNFHL